MENFGKHIYKKPEWQNGNERNTAFEQLEHSEKIANEKLEKILAPDFKNFAVRYMNIEEYRELIENEKISGEFIVADSLYNQPKSFSEFLTKFGTVYNARNQLGKTMWEEMSGITALETANLVEQIKRIEKKNKDKSFDEKNEIIRDYFLQYLNSYDREVARYIKGVDFSSGWTTNSLIKVNNQESLNDSYQNIDFIPEEERAKLREDFLEYVSQNTRSTYGGYPEEKYAKKKQDEYDLDVNQSHTLMLYLQSIKRELDLGAENLKTIQDFKDNPDFLKQKDGLRKIITALGNVHDWMIEEHQHRQYHLALIVDKNIVFGEGTGTSWDVDGWRNLYSTEKLDSDKLRASILGAISVYPLKEMYQEILEIEKGSGDLAHPVFDNKGIVRWPK
jgi:hypothetical protein